MTESRNKIIWTIGHSIRSLDEFIGMLKSFQIVIVVDIRRFPGSKKYPILTKGFYKGHYRKAVSIIFILKHWAEEEKCNQIQRTPFGATRLFEPMQIIPKPLSLKTQ